MIPPTERPLSHDIPFKLTDNHPLKGWKPINCPSGLELLCYLDQLILSKKVTKVTPNCQPFGPFVHAYAITTQNGQQVYSAFQNSHSWTDFDIKDAENSLVFRQSSQDSTENLSTGHRAYQKCKVYCPEEEFGTIIEDERNKLCSLQNDSGHVWATIQQPNCFCCYSEESDAKFSIVPRNGRLPIGYVKRRWVESKTLTFGNVWSINFPMNLNVRCKAQIVSATLLFSMAMEKEHDVQL